MLSDEWLDACTGRYVAAGYLFGALTIPHAVIGIDMDALRCLQTLCNAADVAFPDLDSFIAGREDKTV